MATGKKRVYPSGASKRRAKFETELELSGRWLQLGSRETKLQFNPRGQPIELPLYGQPPVSTVMAISSIIAQLEQGAFYGSAYLADGMTRDDRLAATLNTRVQGLIGCRLNLEPGLDTAQGRKIKEQTEKTISKMVPLHQLGKLLRTGLMMSVGIARIHPYVEDDETVPTFTVWDNRNLRFDWGSRQYRLVTENVGEITIADDDPDWIIYEPYGRGGWRNGALMRCLTFPWLIRHWTRNWWARYQEVHGQPLRLGIVPSTRDSAAEKAFLSQLSNLAHEAVIRLPQGVDGNKFDVKLLEATSNNWQGFEKLLAHCDDSFAIALLGQKTSTTGASGLGSDKNPGDAVRDDYKRSDALIGDVIRDQLLCRWTDKQFGNKALAPYLNWEIDPPEDLEKKAKAFSMVADAVSKFATAPAFARHVDIRAFLESFEIPLVDEDQVPPDVPGTPAPLPVDSPPDPNVAPVVAPANPADGEQAPAPANQPDNAT